METVAAMLEILRREGAALRDTPWGPVAVDFGDWQAEYSAFRQSAGLFQPPAVAQVEVAGSQRAEFLNRLATNKLDPIQPGEGRETFFADSSGRVLHHVFVYAGPESLVLHTAAGRGPNLCSHLDHYLIREDVRIRDRSDEWGELILAGPHAAEVLRHLAAIDMPDGDDYLLATHTKWNGRPLMVRRQRERDFTSFQLAGEAADMGPLWQALRQAGAVACGARALETIRVEEGFPVIGLDITERTLPQEVGRNEKAVSFSKGCYLGQEIVARIDARDAVAKVLSGVRFATAEVPTAGGELTRDGQAVGQITSAAFSPRFGGSVALAYLQRAHHEPGVSLDSAWGRATVVELPMRNPQETSERSAM